MNCLRRREVTPRSLRCSGQATVPAIVSQLRLFFTGSDQRGLILSTPGSYDFVCHGSSPAPIPAEEIEAVHRVVERGLRAEPHPFLKSGDRVRVKSGPLEGLEGILVREKSFYRLVLSVELLVRSISVEVEVADVERVMEKRIAGLEPVAAPINVASGCL